jgi:hypothetical protein
MAYAEQQFHCCTWRRSITGCSPRHAKMSVNSGQILVRLVDSPHLLLQREPQQAATIMMAFINSLTPAPVNALSVKSRTGLVFPEGEPAQRLLRNNFEPGLYRRRKALGVSPQGNPLGQKNLLSQLTLQLARSWRRAEQLRNFRWLKRCCSLREQESMHMSA